MLRETVRSHLRGLRARTTCARSPPPASRRPSCGTRSPARGFLSVNIPEEYGGGGLGMSALAAVGEEIAAAGCSLLLIVVSPAIVGSILARHGTPDQKDTLAARRSRAGTTKVAFAITEPDAGSNSHNLATAARRSNGGYVIRGREDLHLGRRGRGRDPGRRRARATADGNLGLPLLFIVDSDAPGLERSTSRPRCAAPTSSGPSLRRRRGPGGAADRLARPAG